MPARDVAEKIRSALDDIRDADLSDPQLVDVLNLAERLVEAMRLFFSSIDTSVYGEFRYIAEHIARTRDEIASLRPNHLRNERLPNAGAELDAVVGDTEQATETIMEQAEALLAAEPADALAYKAEVDTAMLRIIEACSFQDITGQRVKKVVATLNHIEERIDRFARVMGVADADPPAPDDRSARERDNLLNGPQIGGPATGQEAIDALFDDGDPSGLDQSDIDSLFD